MVDARSKFDMAIIDAYWDHEETVYACSNRIKPPHQRFRRH
jgi:hypothetical protein